MDSLAMIQAVEAWATATIPALSSYDFPPEELDTALPLVMAEINEDATQEQEVSQLPGFAQYQQTFLRTWNVDLIILVSPDPAWTASHTLYGYVDELGAAIRQGVKLDEQVILSQFYDASYEPPEVQYNDGTIARQVTIRVVVGEMIGVS